MCGAVRAFGNTPATFINCVTALNLTGLNSLTMAVSAFYCFGGWKRGICKRFVHSYLIRSLCEAYVVHVLLPRAVRKFQNNQTSNETKHVRIDIRFELECVMESIFFIFLSLLLVHLHGVYYPENLLLPISTKIIWRHLLIILPTFIKLHLLNYGLFARVLIVLFV